GGGDHAAGGHGGRAVPGGVGAGGRGGAAVGAGAVPEVPGGGRGGGGGVAGAVRDGGAGGDVLPGAGMRVLQLHGVPGAGGDLRGRGDGRRTAAAGDQP